MEKLIDIHNHVIPEFDDGPKSIEESLDMLKLAADQGISEIFATSHFNEYIPPELEKEYFSKLQALREEAMARKIGVHLHSGSEIFFHHYVDKTVKSSRVTTLAEQGQYILIEFPMFQNPVGAEEMLFRLSMEKYIPIVAHPERYNLVFEDSQKAIDFIKYGGLLQVNAGSILGLFGKEVQKIAIKLLEQQFVHFIASDAHSSKGRTFLLREAYEFLEDKLPGEYLQELLFDNPRRIIDNIRIDQIKLPAEEEAGFLGRLRERFRKFKKMLK